MVNVRGRLDLQGVRDESFCVVAGAVLVLRGALRGTVRVLPGGECWVLGGATGELINAGGHLVVVGVPVNLVRTLAGTTRSMPSVDTVALTQRGEEWTEVRPPSPQQGWRAPGALPGDAPLAPIRPVAS